MQVDRTVAVVVQVVAELGRGSTCRTNRLNASITARSHIAGRASTWQEAGLIAHIAVISRTTTILIHTIAIVIYLTGIDIRISIIAIRPGDSDVGIAAVVIGV